jgi:hypothetical protein
MANGRAARAILWCFQIWAAFAFVVIGVGKFRNAFWLTAFHRWGYSAEFRMLIGGLEILGGVLIAVPPSVSRGAGSPGVTPRAQSPRPPTRYKLAPVRADRPSSLLRRWGVAAVCLTGAAVLFTGQVRAAYWYVGRQLSWTRALAISLADWELWMLFAPAVLALAVQQAFQTHITAGASVYGDGNAMLEAQFTGTHVGEFEGVTATGREVDVPYAVAYDLRGDKISALRLYFPLDLLMRQIAGAALPVAQAG